jgi:C2 domain
MHMSLTHASPRSHDGSAVDAPYRKRALKPSYFSRDHFSSSISVQTDPRKLQTRVVVRILQGKDLLASDLLTGTSDPVCFVSVADSSGAAPTSIDDPRVQSTAACKHTVNPNWDAELTFPLKADSVEDIMAGSVLITVLDQDDEDGSVHYDALGEVSIPLETIITQGSMKPHTQSIMLNATWWPISKSSSMRRCSGSLKVSLSLVLGPDCPLLGALPEDNCDTTEAAAAFADVFTAVRRVTAATSQSLSASSRSVSPLRGRGAQRSSSSPRQRYSSLDSTRSASPRRRQFSRTRPQSAPPIALSHRAHPLSSTTTTASRSGKLRSPRMSAMAHRTFAGSPTSDRLLHLKAAFEVEETVAADNSDSLDSIDELSVKDGSKRALPPLALASNNSASSNSKKTSKRVLDDDQYGELAMELPVLSDRDAMVSAASSRPVTAPMLSSSTKAAIKNSSAKLSRMAANATREVSHTVSS